METNGQQQKHSTSRTSKRKVILWGLLAVACFLLGVVGFGTDGPWYVFPGSILLAGAAGLFVVRAVRALRSSFKGTPMSDR
jgi:hypothetical protein